MTVNPAYIDKFLAPLIVGADSEDEVAKYGNLNPNTESEVKKLARDLLFPEFQKRIDPFKARMKNTLAYYLSNEKIDFELIYDSLLFPIDTPKNTKQFFKWIWESFFEGEGFEYINNEDILEEDDIEGPLKLIEMYHLKF